VAAFLDVSNASASKAVDRLVRRGLVLRSEDPADRRNIHLSLTLAGRQLLAEYETARGVELNAIFGGFPREEMLRTSELRIGSRRASWITRAGPDEPCLKCGIYFREKCLVWRNCFYRKPGRTAERKDICV
jgi:MarR family